MNQIERNIKTDFYKKISDLLRKARQSVVQTINQTMVFTYFKIGKMIVEEEQAGKERAEYGKQLLQGLSKRLTVEFGKGFSTTNIKQMRSFYLIYSKGQTASDEFRLSWSHYLKCYYSAGSKSWFSITPCFSLGVHVVKIWSFGGIFVFLEQKS